MPTKPPRLSCATPSGPLSLPASLGYKVHTTGPVAHFPLFRKRALIVLGQCLKCLSRAPGARYGRASPVGCLGYPGYSSICLSEALASGYAPCVSTRPALTTCPHMRKLSRWQACGRSPRARDPRANAGPILRPPVCRCCAVPARTCSCARYRGWPHAPRL